MKKTVFIIIFLFSAINLFGQISFSDIKLYQSNPNNVETSLRRSSYWRFSFNLINSNYIDDIDYIRITFFDTNETTYLGANDSKIHTEFAWSRDTGNWSDTEWNINYSATFPKTSISGTRTNNFILGFYVADDATIETTNVWFTVIKAKSTNNSVTYCTQKYKMARASYVSSQDDFFAVPNPLRFFSSDMNEKFTFMYNGQFRSKATISIKIFDMSGNLIRKLPDYYFDETYDSKTGSLGIEWNAKNGKGINVISGTYLATMEVIYSDNGEITVKEFMLMVIR